ncbi:MAG: hypothetical protein HZA21_05915 [Nitrospirae bacterium]|nr:hypothetical protein [Nitrospirota bacterium]
MWTPRLNAVLGSLVVTIGFWMTWGEMPPALTVLLALVVAVFLDRQGSMIARVWAWATLLLGLESLAWPIVTMVRIRMASAEPSDQEMGLILTAVLFGLVSSIFWLTFAYGIFKWIRRKEAEGAGQR